MAVQGKMTGIFEIFQRGEDDLLAGFVKLVMFEEETVSFLLIKWSQKSTFILGRQKIFPIPVSLLFVSALWHRGYTSDSAIVRLAMVSFYLQYSFHQH